MKEVSPLFAYAHDGKRFYKAVMVRLRQFPDVSLAELCAKAKIDFTTSWRWKGGSKPCAATVNALEAAFGKLEKAAAHIKSSSSGNIPSALL